jgi:4-amino-4-deoxy-L-arabinose transferase-like glycosyltransferase
MDRRTRWGILIVFGMTLIVGFYLRYEAWLETRVRHPLQQDALDYFSYAYNLRHHKIYSKEFLQPPDSNPQLSPDALRTPGYPLFLAVMVNSPPTRYLIKKIAFWQMVVSMLTIVLAFFLFRRFLLPAATMLAAIFLALSPHLIIFNNYILTETLFCFSLVLTGLAAWGFAKRPSVWLAALLGGVMGLATLVRPSLQFFPLVAAILVFAGGGLPKKPVVVPAMLLGFVVIISPWYIRNMVTLGRLSDQTLMINFLHHGLYPDFKYKQIPASHSIPYRFDPRSPEIRKDLSSVVNEIKNRFRSEPRQHLKWYLFKKPLIFWSWDTLQGHGDTVVYYLSQNPYTYRRFFQWTHKAMHLLHLPLIFLSLAGSLLVWLAPRSIGGDRVSMFIARFVSALMLYYTLIHIIGAPFPRYSVPLRPFQYAMGLLFLQQIWRIAITAFRKIGSYNKESQTET